MAKRIVVLAGDHDTTINLVHFLERDFEVVKVIIEESVPRFTFLMRRVKKCGWWSVFGQGLFSVVVMPLLRREGMTRANGIKKEYGLRDAPVDETKIERVVSVNDAATATAVAASAPDWVIVWGTRILSKNLLSQITVPIINIHVGIVPQYRGSNGGYWALYHNDAEHFGTTVHLIDEGIDTGGVLAQGTVLPSERDNFATYPLLQLGIGLRLLVDVLKQESLASHSVTAAFSKIWYHPTIWEYCITRLRFGVK